MHIQNGAGGIQKISKKSSVMNTVFVVLWPESRITAYYHAYEKWSIMKSKIYGKN
jgi:hypothetical protein